MPDLRTDAQLVNAYTAGDRGALAGIYDRFSAGLYDTAAAMLRDRHEAADAMQDVFLIAAERMGQLREPERLKPWLYAILRNEVYRRSKKRGRQLPTDFSAMGAPELAAPTAPDAEGEGVSAAELAELVRSAACGLDERDQLVLELSVRQGLQGADLAAALGVTPEQSYTLVHRMRDRVDRSLGALVVARAGRKDCADLADVLKGWDGQFTVLVRKRVARHVEHCATCERTRKKAAPLALLGSAPAFAAPVDLRDQILSKAGQPGAAPRHTYRFDADGGFPRIVRTLRWPAAVAAGLAAILIGFGGGAIIAANTNDGAAAAPASTEIVTTAATEATVPTATDGTASTVDSTSSSTGSTGSTTSTSTSTPATTAVPATIAAPTPGTIELSASVVDLGATSPNATFQVRNPGGLPIDFTITGDPAEFGISNTGTSVPAGGHRTITVSLDRTGRSEGDLQRQLTVSGGGVSLALVLRGSVEHAPVLTLDGPSGTYPACQFTDQSVYVTYTDESGIAFPATVHWDGPVSGDNQLKERGDIAVYGTLLLTSPPKGAYTYTITVTDTRGNVATVTGSFTLSPC